MTSYINPRPTKICHTK